MPRFGRGCSEFCVSLQIALRASLVEPSVDKAALFALRGCGHRVNVSPQDEELVHEINLGCLMVDPPTFNSNFCV